MYPAINSLNRHFRFAKFVLDTDDNTIQVEMDTAFRSRDVGEICYELLIRMVDICDTGPDEGPVGLNHFLLNQSRYFIIVMPGGFLRLI